MSAVFARVEAIARKSKRVLARTYSITWHSLKELRDFQAIRILMGKSSISYDCTALHFISANPAGCGLIKSIFMFVENVNNKLLYV